VKINECGIEVITLYQIVIYYKSVSVAGLPDLLSAMGPNLVQKRAKKEPNFKTRGQKRPTIFSQFVSSYKVM